MKHIVSIIAVVLTLHCLVTTAESNDWRWVLTDYPSEYAANTGTSFENRVFIASYDEQTCTGQVFRTDDLGHNWTNVHSFTNQTYLTSIVCVSTGQLFLMVYDCEKAQHIVLESDDYGENWQPVSPIPDIDEDVERELVKIWPGINDTLYVTGTFLDNPGLHLLISHDYGTTWLQGGLFEDDVHTLTAFAEVTPDHLMAGSFGNQVFDSRDGGQTWEISLLPAMSEITALEHIDSERYLAGMRSYPVLFAREWSGADWYQIAEFASVRHLLNSSQSILYAATGGVFQSLDSGMTWNEMEMEPSKSFIIHIFEAKDGYLYSTGGHAVFRSEEAIIPPTVTPTVGPGTPTNTPHPPTLTPTPRPTITPPFTSTPSTFTRTPEPTPECDRLGIRFEHPSDNIIPGDTFFLTAKICNTLRFTLTDIPLFVLLEFNGSFWFGPSWSVSVDHYQSEWLVGLSELTIIPEFVWPANVEAITGAVFWGALTDSTVTGIIGDYDFWEFSNSASIGSS